MYNKQKQQGFTIVELLIVIVVIGILAAITIVAYGGVQEKARMSAAKAYAGQISRSPDTLDAKAVWGFDECSGATVSDASEASNAGTIVGTASWSSDTPSGTGCSINLNGATRVTTNALIGATFYIKAAWVKTSICGGSNNVISGDGSAFYSCDLKAGHNGSWNTLTSTTSVGDGKWHYVLLKYESGNLSMYVDGRQTSSASGQPAPTILTNTIGALNTGNFYTGLIDDVLIIAR